MSSPSTPVLALKDQHRTRLPALCLLAAVVASTLAPGASLADQHIYSDDFSTDQAIADSYEHSDFLESLPDPWPLAGFLLYEYHQGDRVLSFYYGSAHDAYARLNYELPLDGGTSGVEFASASVRLEVVSALSLGFIQCGCSLFDGYWWEWPIASEPGLYTFQFAGSVPTQTVFVYFRGYDVSVDDLTVTLDYFTPVESLTWTRIKHMFGGASS